MDAPGDIFHVCRRYVPDRVVAPLDRQGVADCVTCAHQYEDRTCPIFRARLLRAMAHEIGVHPSAKEEEP